jgi:cell division protein FtsX
LSTLDAAKPLMMDLKDYAQLVFDFSTDLRANFGSEPLPTIIKATLSNVKLTSSRKALPKDPPGTVQKVKEIFEGWVTKYGQANAGFGVVVAILIVLLLGIAFLLFINTNRIAKQQQLI